MKRFGGLGLGEQELRGLALFATRGNCNLRSDPSRPKAFMHNGYFQSLKDVVHFYNTRDLGGFPPPEVKANLNTEELGKLGLSDAEENAIVAFLKTLTDRQ